MVKSNSLRLARLRFLASGKHGDGRGLWLHKRRDGAQWVYRFTLYGRTREMGLGALRDVGLAEAREAAETARRLVAQEIDPIKARRRARARARRRDGRSTIRPRSAFAGARVSRARQRTGISSSTSRAARRTRAERSACLALRLLKAPVRAFDR
ncbi:hypothetical protein DRV85_00420 [Rhodosalinus halophilus]|uniref:Integrase DNA-binding domain-containing protein n=1 Tax=Rhodosalinus halophilus TaxID=2259333 RepID=A0A365UD07_9RHOB|nr:integrase arm-type DNA-binding domain-containing protein [Rhodosalinus halophilus]RBI87436.1 hypothetical protein DRV85_00420 [Rhodosalinus halophilus]